MALGAVTGSLADTSTLVVNGTGTFDLGGRSDTVGGVQLVAGTIQNGTLTSTTNYDLQSGTVSAVLAGSVGADKTTAGTVDFTGANTYTGLTTVSAGTLNLNTTGDNALSGNLTVSGGSTV